MSSLTHEGLAEMFRLRPEFAAELLTDVLGLRLPQYERVHLSATEFVDPGYSTYQADVVVSFTNGERTTFAVVVEIQLNRDTGKSFSWPVYLSGLRARFRCPTMLLVISTRRPVATWCAVPIDLGHPGLTLGPLVIGPDRIPVIVDADQARRSPELALLSALMNASDAKVLQAFATGLVSVDNPRNAMYADMVFAAAPKEIRSTLEEIVKRRRYEYQSDFVRRYIFQGRAEGGARVVLAVLEERDIDFSEAEHDRILSCADVDLLELWARRAATIDTIDDLFQDS